MVNKERAVAAREVTVEFFEKMSQDQVRRGARGVRAQSCPFEAWSKKNGCTGLGPLRNV